MGDVRKKSFIHAKALYLQVGTDVLILSLALFYIFFDSIFFIFIFIIWIVVAVLFLAACFMTIWFALENKSGTAFLAFFFHILTVVIAFTIFKNAWYIDVAYYFDSVPHHAIVQQIERETRSDTTRDVQSWPRTTPLYTRSSSHITFKRSGTLLAVMFTKDCGLWTCSGFMYVSQRDKTPECFDTGARITSMKQVQPRWYWIDCSID